ncbi:MAG: hypothetical protein PF440_05025 [Thiomicrorhabdus sp.]|jgi:hypothetical protein|nr:hypothetical protein [Thiomicrorhabdus sp.]
MDTGIIQFQSLSRCEAAQLCEAVTSTILSAYQAGFNVVANNYDKDLECLFMAHREALEAIGFGHIPISDALSMIKFGIRMEE